MRAGAAPRAPRLLLITDHSACRWAGRTVEATARAALSAPGRIRPWLLVRAKDAPLDERLALVRELAPSAAGAGAGLLVHASGARALEAVAGLRSAGVEVTGVHLPSAGDVDEARAALGPDLVVGASRHRGDPLDEDATRGLDYVTWSPVCAPLSKRDARPPLGFDGLAAGCREAARPVIALGGMGPDQVRPALAAGAYGVAALGAVMSAADPAAVTAALLSQLEADSSAGARGATGGLTRPGSGGEAGDA